MKRLFDIALSLVAASLFIGPMVLISLAILVSSSGPILYWSDRIGRNNRVFRMPKFRSMKVNAPTTATHLLEHPDQWLTPFGVFLRKYSLDELPQLWSIVKGDMSFVGPRPALFNQDDLIQLRTQKSIHCLTPGLTGWAQVNGRDNLTIQEKVEFDEEYCLKRSLWLDVVILWLTICRVSSKSGISH